MSTIDICQELHQNFIDFAYEANSQRAFPDARDGLKPGQRACLWEMYIKGYSSNKPHVKSAKVSGGTAATWWPHGTTAIYETFARMSQPWVNNIPEVDWHGSNGNQVIGPSPAADRYTEARLAKAIEEGMFQGIKKNNVPMLLNFSEDEEWPEVLPAIFPRLLVNGSQGIGVTVAQTWLPYNLGELGAIIEKYVKTGELDCSTLYPDFPTGGTIVNKKDLAAIHTTGKGKAIVRGKAEIKNKSILITEFPYQVYVEPFLDEVKELVEKGELTGIAEIYNKSDKKKLLVEVVCDENPQKVLNKLYKSTSLQKNFNANQMALVGKTPQMLTLKDYLDIYIQHNLECLKREYSFDLEKAEFKLEITDGLLKALESIDNIISLIKKSSSSSDAQVKLCETYQFTQNQAKAIVDMRLGKLAHLEYVELQNDKKKYSDIVSDCKALLASEELQKTEYLNRFIAFVKKFAAARKTEITQLETSKDEEDDAVTPEDCVLIVTENNAIKRIPSKSFKVQRRNTTGLKNKEDIVKFSYKTNTVDNLLIFTNTGKMYKLLVDNIPEGTNTSKGIGVQNLVNFTADEYPIAYTTLRKDTDAKYVLFVTKQGLIKRVPLEDYASAKRSGLKATTLKENDSLAGVTFVGDEGEIILVTKLGMAIRMSTSTIPVSSRIAQGCKGMGLKEGDSVLTALTIRHNTDTLFVAAENGYGKRINLTEFTSQNRGGKGSSCSRYELVSAMMICDDDNILVLGDKSSVCISAKEVSTISRASLGNMLIKNNTKIKSVCKV